MKNNILISTTLVLLTTTILFGIGLSSNSTSATTTSTATATVKVAASCTLTTSGGGNYSATVPNGTSAEIAGSTMSVSCNDAGGFALYAVGYSDDTIGNNNMIGTSTNIPTNTSGTNSYWAMKINPTSGNTPTIENSFNNYHIVPDIHTKVASYASSTGTGSLSVNATYKANISSTQLAGNYLGKVKYTLVHPANEVPPHEVACEARRICYNANTNIVEGQMGKDNTYNDTSITLWAPNFKRDGYGFAGWSDKYDYETNPDAHFYGPQETIDIPSETYTYGLPLYAVWIKSQGTIQNWKSCSNLTQDPYNGTANLSSITALTDSRDNNTYAVAKLADGQCWMIENLRLDSAPELSSVNTHNPSIPLTNADNTISNHLSLSTDPTSVAWCISSSAECINQSVINNNNTTAFINNTSSNYNPTGNIYNYGNYYNWYSATAGRGIYSMTSGNVAGDICPIGWHLPTGDSSGELKMLDTIINNTTEADKTNNFRSFPINYSFSGYIYNSSFSNRNRMGEYHTATAMTTDVSYRFFIGLNGISAGSDGQGKYFGKAVRCIIDH